MIRYIQELFQCEVDAKEDGSAYIFGWDATAVQDARSLVQDLVTDVRVGGTYSAEVSELRDYGVLVRLTRAQEALLHISEITHDPQLVRRPVEEILAVGQRVDVQVGKISLWCDSREGNRLSDCIFCLCSIFCRF